MRARQRFSPTKARALRRRRRLGAEQVASDALRSVEWLSAVEAGERTPSADELFDLMYALDCTSAEVSAAVPSGSAAARRGA